MITNHILEDKWRVQRELNEQAGSEPGRYIALVQKRVLEAQERYGIQFRYVETEAEPLREAADDPIAADGEKSRR
ncbi:MAG TPA: hypothetical protein VFC23_14555, partial [Thermoanaerobaculia bacterium]|nr:hypothetical protein [Thermoanaerobaculia bacterium]